MREKSARNYCAGLSIPLCLDDPPSRRVLLLRGHFFDNNARFMRGRDRENLSPNIQSCIIAVIANQKRDNY